MQILPVSCRDIFDDPNAPALFEEYARECALPEMGAINPQQAMYEAMEKSGSLQVFGVYLGRMLIGFAWLITWIVPHYGKKMLSTESIFISAAHRAMSVGRDLVRFIVNYGRKTGCGTVQITAPVGSRFARYLSHLKGFRHSNNVYILRLAA